MKSRCRSLTTLRENILDDIVSNLAGTTQRRNAHLRSRVVPLQRGESPALVVEAISDTPEQNTSFRRWTGRSLCVSVINTGDKPDEVADPIVESLHSKIMADLTLGGYAIDVQPGTTTFEMVDADQPAGVIGVEYLVRYRTVSLT